MARHRRSLDAGESDSDFSPEIESCFNEEEVDLSGEETETTDVDLQDNDDLDIEDQIQLFGGNIHPPEYYRRGIEEFNESSFVGEDYSPGSTILLDAIELQWQQFCNEVLSRDPHACFESISVGILYKFFEWRLNQKAGKDGRKLRGTTKSSSLGTAWKVFRLVYERAVGAKLDTKLNRNMHKVLRELAKKHALSDQKRANRCMTINDLKEQIETTLNTTRKSFDLGEHRILAVLFLLLLAPAGSRPTSILRLRFGDIRVALARDPEGGPHKILIRFTLEFTKSYLGTKDAKTFTIPEMMFDPSLLLSPHAFLLGILFRHQAFRASHLTSPRQLDELDIHPGERELSLPLRNDLKEVRIFRRAVKTLTGYEMSATKTITNGMIASWIKRVGEIMGLQYETIPYSLRYNAANEFDQSPNMSEALRNLSLDHANSVPFQKHYLGRIVRADPWAIIRREKPQQALIDQACSIGHSMSKRRPTGLTAEQTASVVSDPHVRRLTIQLRKLRPRSERHKKIQRELRSLKQKLKRELKQKIRDDWTDEQAVDDIERQLQGIGFAEPMVDDAIRPQRPAQKLLVKALTAPVGDTLEGQYQRRDNAIEAIVAYCSVEEGPTVRRCISSTTVSRENIHEPSEGDPLFLATVSVFVDNPKERPRRCFLCVGAALSLPRDDPRVEDKIGEFYTPGDLSKHFRRRHLSKLRDNDRPVCQVCDMTLSHKMHLQKHAIVVHGTVS
ncbi:C2H2 finger domain-containing protein [Pochonia chlamydosporia 170]|uniref:C2H2 finger domain-containing protein n=1 Tax=Pochonia chlamydosporia 170 TaxID=1380566 RepID=A0A179EYD3_METCM|nr:C2H2 finger domain-containing protein [Pochonia chlamydosporia 170]OAQ58191.1 C2H2 finger domain-containing protein [Pochonia chlamydosporia 170]